MQPEPTPFDVPFRIWWAGGKLKGKFEKSCDDQEIEFYNKNESGLVVRFCMTDDGGTGLLFPDQLDRAIWVRPVNKKQDPCPTKAETWDVFVPLRVVQGGTILEVRNFNRLEQLFKFSLNFTHDPKDRNAKLECWDPIGSNRNGGRLLHSRSFTQTVLGVGAAVAALAAIARLFRSYR